MDCWLISWYGDEVQLPCCCHRFISSNPFLYLYVYILLFNFQQCFALSFSTICTLAFVLNYIFIRIVLRFLFFTSFDNRLTPFYVTATDKHDMELCTTKEACISPTKSPYHSI